MQRGLTLCPHTRVVQPEYRLVDAGRARAAEKGTPGYPLRMIQLHHQWGSTPIPPTRPLDVKATSLYRLVAGVTTEVEGGSPRFVDSPVM